MFLNTNQQLQTIAKQNRGSNGKEDLRNTNIFTRKILGSAKALMFVVTLALTFFVINTDKAQAQSRGYWATDGCYYQAYGNRWQRVECRYYDKQGTLVAKNGNGTFYWFNGQWHNIQSYTLAQLNEGIIRSLGAQNQAIINEFMISNGGPNGTVNLPRAIANELSAPWMRSRRPRYQQR